jgi:ethanolamine ammonia-lyase small subunit
VDRKDIPAPTWPPFIQRIRARTPARVLVDRAGGGYRTETQLELRAAHAAARDAVRTELDLKRDFNRDFVRKWRLFEVTTRERPGLATAESLSAYMAFRPRSGDNDARRNLISNIHARGVPVPAAAVRIVNLAAAMRAQQISGAQLKETLESPKWLKGEEP